MKPDRVSRVFLTKLVVVFHDLALRCSIKCWRIAPSWRDVSSAMVFVERASIRQSERIYVQKSPL